MANSNDDWLIWLIAKLPKLREASYITRYSAYLPTPMQHFRPDLLKGDDMILSHNDKRIWHQFWKELKRDWEQPSNRPCFGAARGEELWFLGRTGKALSTACAMLGLNRRVVQEMICHFAGTGEALESEFDLFILTQCWFSVKMNIDRDLVELPLVVRPAWAPLFKVAVERFRDRYFDMNAWGHPEDWKWWEPTDEAWADHVGRAERDKDRRRKSMKWVGD